MPAKRVRKHGKPAPPVTLEEKYPPSAPCTCDVCRAYCARPGWLTVAQAARAIESGHASRMMLEMSPDLSFGVLSPAYKGCEAQFVNHVWQSRGCTFLQDGLCELFGTGLQPLECRYCHHTRRGLGEQCHADIEKDWRTPAGVSLVVKWSRLTGLWEKMAARAI